MQRRVAPGSQGDPGRLTAAVLSDPDLIEKGFRVLEADFRAGDAGVIDLLGLDRGGSLALVAIAGDSPEAALARLLDQFAWARDERDLLQRIYAEHGLRARMPVRCLLLSSGYSHAFLRRLALLSVDVTPYLARPVTVRGESVWVVEAAAPIFGLRDGGLEIEEVPGEVGLETAGGDAAALTPDGARGREDTAVPAATGGPGEPAGVAVAPAEAALLDDLPLPAAFEVITEVPVSGVAAAVAGDGAAEAADPLESLSAEELEEFERFDRQRREAGRSS